MYHFDDNREAPSLELSYAELRRIVTLVGFRILVCVCIYIFVCVCGCMRD